MKNGTMMLEKHLAKNKNPKHRRLVEHHQWTRAEDDRQVHIPK
jgi:hypothetical protein